MCPQLPCKRLALLCMRCVLCVLTCDLDLCGSSFASSLKSSALLFRPSKNSLSSSTDHSFTSYDQYCHHHYHHRHCHTCLTLIFASFFSLSSLLFSLCLLTALSLVVSRWRCCCDASGGSGNGPPERRM